MQHEKMKKNMKKRDKRKSSAAAARSRAPGSSSDKRASAHVGATLPESSVEQGKISCTSSTRRPACQGGAKSRQWPAGAVARRGQPVARPWRPRNVIKSSGADGVQSPGSLSNIGTIVGCNAAAPQAVTQYCLKTPVTALASNRCRSGSNVTGTACHCTTHCQFASCLQEEVPKRTSRKAHKCNGPSVRVRQTKGSRALSESGGRSS